MKNIVVGQSGGPTAVINSSVAGVYKRAKELGIKKVYGMVYGIEGFLNENLIDLDEYLKNKKNYELLKRTPSAFLGSCRHKLPKIEGNEEITDSRRGKGVYKQLVDSMGLMKKNNIIFGASLTFTRNNLTSLLSREFIDELHDFGCKVVFFIEYVPVNGETKEMAPRDEERELLLDNLESLREEYQDMLFMSFPGDEKNSGGCLAAGRGFFHINSHGGAEPCPASPYSDINVKETSLIEALNSKLFKSLREGGILMGEHEGGCVLFEHQKEVERLLED